MEKKSATEPDVRIIVVAYNSESCLQDCIDKLHSQTHEFIEIVIVDNGGLESSEKSHKISLPDSRFSHWKSSTNLGFSGGFHWAASSASTKWIMSVNPDTMLDELCVEKLLEAAIHFKDPEMLSPCLFSNQERDILDGAGDSLSVFGIAWRNSYGNSFEELDLMPTCEVFSPSGAAALYLRAPYEIAGGMNPKFFCYMEDVDLGIRIRGHGGRCILVNEARGIHYGGHSTNNIAGFSIRYSARNSILMIISSAPLLILIPLLVLHVIGQSWLQWRNKGTEIAKHRSVGYKESFALVPSAVVSRIKRKRYPVGASFRLLKRLSWKISDLRNRPVRFWIN